MDHFIIAIFEKMFKSNKIKFVIDCDNEFFLINWKSIHNSIFAQYNKYGFDEDATFKKMISIVCDITNNRCILSYYNDNNLIINMK